MSAIAIHSCASSVYTLLASFLFADAKAAEDKFACASMSFAKDSSICVIRRSLYPWKISKVDHFNAIYAVRAVFKL